MKRIKHAAGVMGFANAILHGNKEHRAWLLEAAECYTTGRMIPRPHSKVGRPRKRQPVFGVDFNGWECDGMIALQESDPNDVLPAPRTDKWKRVFVQIKESK